ncbi:MAG: hypothetical protein M1504_00315 [Candidatus Marsarchaeota archaeon]|nr:hypothetical protein [Candidatus Marsarchaeota archaeon]
MRPLDSKQLELDQAIDLVKSNKSIFVWIGGYVDTPVSKILNVEADKVIEANPFTLMDKETYPKELLNYEPIIVCHHGLASYELAKELDSMNIKGYSLMGGVESIKTRI